jgi:hypothetical protein
LKPITGAARERLRPRALGLLRENEDGHGKDAAPDERRSTRATRASRPFHRRRVDMVEIVGIPGIVQLIGLIELIGLAPIDGNEKAFHR